LSGITIFSKKEQKKGPKNSSKEDSFLRGRNHRQLNGVKNSTDRLGRVYFCSKKEREPSFSCRWGRGTFLIEEEKAGGEGFFDLL